MKQTETLQLLLFHFHRAVGSAYRTLVTEAKQGLISDDDIRRIECESISKIGNRDDMPDEFLCQDNQVAQGEAKILAREFFSTVRATMRQVQLH